MRRRRVSHLGKGVHSEDGQVRLRLGVVHQIQVDQFLQLQAVRLHTVDHVWEQRADVLPNRHTCNDLLDGFLLPLPLVALEVQAKLCELTCDG